MALFNLEITINGKTTRIVPFKYLVVDKNKVLEIVNSLDLAELDGKSIKSFTLEVPGERYRLNLCID
jgi:hypothetical protein